MYIVTTSFIVNYSVHQQWIDFVKPYLASLRDKGYEEITFTKVLSNDHSGSATYSLQIGLVDLGKYEELTGDLLAGCFDLARKMFGEDVMWFTSLLKRIDF